MELEIINKTTLHDGFLKIEKISCKYNSETKGEVHDTVEVCSRPDAVAVVLKDIETQEFILVKQIRIPTHESGKPWLLELAAGLIDEGESPEEAAMREVREELGYHLTEVEKITCFYTSPGYSSEVIHLFYAEVTQEMKKSEGGGLEEENEDIEEVRIPSYATLNMIEDDTFRDAKTIIGLRWAAS